MILALLVGIAIGIGATIVGIVVIEDLMEKRRE
jgi:hypothetical protein